jgi:N-acetylmuramoyl-L-alanine amidase-like protein
MRALLASSIGVASTAALLLPTALPAAAASHGDRDAASVTASADRSVRAGSNHSLPLVPLAATDSTRAADSTAAADQAVGVEPRTVDRFSLLGIVWDDPDADLPARVQVRTRAIGSKTWSPWRSLSAEHDHGPDLATREDADRGATDPLWVGPSDGVQVRVSPEAGRRLPDGLHLALVDPGTAATDAQAADLAAEADAAPGTHGASGSADRALRSQKVLPALTGKATRARAGKHQHIGPRPGIVTRHGWGADVNLREGGFLYNSTVKMAFVHHTATTNAYSCKQAPSIIRGIYRYHVVSLGWRDIGYNFLIDKCGTIYEGRAGGVREPVQGAHTLGFNKDSVGVAVIGSFQKKAPPKAATDAIAKLTAWKLGLFDRNPEGKVTMTSGGSGKYSRGERVRMNVISGHRDGYRTECPGQKLYDELGSIRALAAKLQGR